MPKDHEAVAWYAWQLWHSPATAKLHNAALPSVSASQSQAPFVSVTASRPSGEGNRLYAKLPSLDAVAQPSALPGRFRALRAASWLPCGCCGTVALVRRFAQCSGQWPTAIPYVCAPPTLVGLAATRRLALRWVPVRPQGAPSSQRKILLARSKNNAAGASRLRCLSTTPPTSRKCVIGNDK
jgi:hypothetical protein